MIETALIVGGGVGGMSAALALSRIGIAVKLIDTDPHWRAYGAGISLTGLALRAFEKLGMLEELRDRGFVGGGLRLRGVDGTVVMEAPRPAPDADIVEASGGIMRPALHEIMQEHIRRAGIEVELGLEAVAYHDSGDGVVVEFAGGGRHECDLAVVADGIFSSARAVLFPEAAPPRFTGQGCWRFVAGRPAEVDRLEMYIGGQVKVGINPISSDKLYAFILEHLPDNPRFAEEEMLDRLKAMLAPFGGPIAEIRAGLSANSAINYRPLEWLLLPPPWHKGRVVLIGDAIHATTPHMAAGAGLAAEDGLVLAEELERAEDVVLALEAFTARRFERARMVVENSVRIGEIEMAGGSQIDANRMLGETAQKLKQPY